MNIIRATLLLILSVTGSVQATAQTDQIPNLAVEYGNLSELFQRHRVFVYTENLESRERILRELAKYPRLMVVGRKEEADFILLFGANLVRNSPSSLDNFAGIDDSVVIYGDMVALRLIKHREGPRIRILWYTRKRQVFTNTDQFFRSNQFNNGRALWWSFLFRTYTSYNPRLKWITFNRATEANCTREFIKAMEKIYRERR